MAACVNMRKLTVALIQLSVGTNKAENLKHAAEKIREAACTTKLDLIALPECFNCPYGVNFFKEYSEQIPCGETCTMLSELAKQYEVFLLGGTIPEIDSNKIYNTCTVWNPKGDLVGKYRKMHLFNIDIPGKITFKESEVLHSGNELCMFDCKGIKVGVGICYDIRFPALAQIYRERGCELLVYPGAFNMTTGPLHWELLQRSRALDNQLFMCCISPAKGKKGYIAWGHSQITSPWGTVKSLKFEEDILIDTLDFEECTTIREQIPITKQRRDDLYEFKWTGKC